MPKSFRVARSDESGLRAHLRHVTHDVTHADKYRLLQAEELLREAGFAEREDGTWHPAR